MSSVTIAPARAAASYREIVAAAAADVRRMRRGSTTVHVWAWPAFEGLPGVLVVTTDDEGSPADPYGAHRRVFPIYVSAKPDPSWSWTPQDAIHTRLWHALRREPIMGADDTVG